MKDGFAALHRLFDAHRIANIAGDHLHMREDFRVYAVKQAPRVKGIVLHHRLYPASFPHEPLGKMRADKSVSARHKNGFAVKHQS